MAKAVVEKALQYQVSSIVLPDLTNIKEILNSKIQAKAEIKIPGVKKAQKAYAKRYRENINQWSYGRLSEAIKSKAAKFDIAVECIPQYSPKMQQEQAANIALSAYEQRVAVVS